MSKLEELIQTLCPDGVEYKTLGEVLGVNRGKRLTKSELSDDGQYYVYHGSKDTPLGKYTQFNVKGNTTIVVNTGGIGGVKYCDDDFWCSDGSFWIGHSPVLNDKFVYYLLSPMEFFFASQKRVGGVPTIDRSVVENVSIPVPPLPVQEEIVRILDALTAYTAELQAELQARRNQYDYYRNRLLSFDGDTSVQWRKLGEVCSVLRGKRLTKSELDADQPYPVYHGGLEPLGFYKEPNRPANMTMVINVGASAGTIGFCEKPFWSSDGCYCIQCSPYVIDKYVFYALCCQTLELKSKVRVAGIPTLDRPVVEQLLIPIPPLSEQQRIVDILDRFDTLCNDLTTGLPAEIEARQKQYEHYRDRLLSFKKKEA